MLVPQKLGKILENKVVQKLKLETLYSPKEMLSKIDIIKLKFKKKSLSNFDIEITILAIFDRLSFIERFCFCHLLLSMLIFVEISCLLGSTFFEIT